MMPEIASRAQNLAYCYENAMTVILRLSSIQAGSQDFRTSIRAALRAAMELAKSLGYSSEINQLAFFAVVALLDESVLKTQNPAFADWAQRPLQEEMFGHFRAGEVFFDHLQSLLARQDSPETADCLEVYCLCLLLGFQGKYALAPGRTFISATGAVESAGSARGTGEISSLIRQCRQKVDRIRGQVSFLPDSPIPVLKQNARRDAWGRSLGIAAAILFLIFLISFSGAWLALSSGASQLG